MYHASEIIVGDHIILGGFPMDGIEAKVTMADTEGVLAIPLGDWEEKFFSYHEISQHCPVLRSKKTPLE